MKTNFITTHRRRRIDNAGISLLCGILWLAGLMTSPAWPEGLTWNGAISSDLRLSLHGRHDFTWNEHRLDLKTEALFGGRAKAFANAWLRYADMAGVVHANDLSIPAKVMPTDLSLREAYFDVYGLGIKELDLRIGRQRIAWGRADRLNPTDNLDADELEDIWDFGRHLSSDALKLTWYQGPVEVQGVVIPFFRPAVLPRGAWAEALMRPPEFPEEFALYESVIDIVEYSDTVLTPVRCPGESSVGGVKVTGVFHILDASISYVYGRDDFPVAGISQVNMPSPDSMVAMILSGRRVPAGVRAALVYPRMHVLGFDAAGAFGDAGVWIEGAAFFPEKIEMDLRVPSAGMTLRQKILDKTPYIKIVAGCDYTFPGGLYVNAQYVHGFMHERGENLEDYLIVDARWDFFQERLTVAPFGIGLEVRDFDDFENSYAVLYQPQIELKPLDNVKFGAGVRIIDGRKNSTFGRMRDRDECFFKAQFTF